MSGNHAPGSRSSSDLVGNVAAADSFRWHYIIDLL